MVDDIFLGSWNGCFTLFNFCCSFLFLCLVCTSVRLAFFGALWIVLWKRVWFFPKDLSRVVDCAITCACSVRNRDNCNYFDARAFRSY